MKRSWFAVVAIAVIGALAGVAIAGMPSSVNDGVVNEPSSTTTATSVVATTATPATTDSVATTSAGTTAPNTTEGFDRAAVRVVVANGSRFSGVARSASDRLKAAGFTDVQATDASDLRAVSAVFARDGFEPAAQAVATELGLAVTVVEPLAGEVTALDASADVVVVLGNDYSA